MSLQEFNNLVNDDFVLVDFYANWCGPCKMLSPVLEELENSRGVKVVKVDVDKNEEVARTYGVMSIPTLIMFKNGELVDKKVGYIPIELLSDWINEKR
ncbi:MAG: thioredoxin [Candidatus Faecisoma sp.]|jgi:thioredoxin 1|nr:thioredoxin [Acholeplasma sp.]MCI5678292.1 thioredoxin [Acholeplasma sp.]MDY2892847.1 thioredoxin [Candidatus Faecisoma sp.]CCY27283.1 thioredoxin [Acholeplasma sp. CAG:878]